MYKFIVNLLLVFLLAACTIRHAPDFPAEDSAGNVVMLAESKEALVVKLKKLAREVETFRGLARAQLELEDTKSTLRYAIVFQTPQLLRIETLPLNAAYSLSILTAGGEQGVFLIPPEKKALVGKADQALLWRVLGAAIRRDVLMDILSARIGFLPDSSQIEAFQNDMHSTYQLVAGESARILVDSNSLMPKQIQLRDSFQGKVALDVEYHEYMSVDGIVVPKHLTIHAPKRGFKVDLNFSNIKVNSSLDRSLFQIDIPSGYMVLRR